MQVTLLEKHLPFCHLRNAEGSVSGRKDLSRKFAFTLEMLRCHKNMTDSTLETMSFLEI